MKKKLIKKRAVKKIVVTRKWLTDFANTIYNPKTKKFLNLCRGTLQNGPDPKDGKRTMHCGLGELYFHLTGLQPNSCSFTESEIALLVTNQSSLVLAFEKNKLDFSNKIFAINNKIFAVNNEKPFENYFYNEIEYLAEKVLDLDILSDPKIKKFNYLILQIPIENDKGLFCGNFQFRARRVAALLRKAAKLLP